MSECHEIIGDMVDDRAAATTDPVVNLRTEETIQAEIEVVQEIPLESDLGKDARESVTLHVRDRSADIEMGDQVQFTLYGQTCTFQVTERMDNPGNPFVEYKAVKLVANIDA